MADNRANTTRESGNEIIFGDNSIVLSNNRKLTDSIQKKIEDNKISFEPLDSMEEKLMELIEKDERFKDIKNRANIKYSVYNIDKKIGEFEGKFTYRFGAGGGYAVHFDDKSVTGFFINGNYNHMPRKVDVYVNVEKDENKHYTIKKYKDYNEKDVESAVENQIGPDKKIVIAQLFECDLNGDGKIEKIVNYNNALEDAGEIYENYMNVKEGDYDNYYAIIVLLDEYNKVIDYIQDKPHFVINSASDYVDRGGEIFTSVGYLLDVDNDNIMEVISFLQFWEGWGYRFSKLYNDFIFNKDKINGM